MYGTWVATDERAAEMARRAVQNAAELDARLARFAEHWRLERVGLVERSILRLALGLGLEGVELYLYRVPLGATVGQHLLNTLHFLGI
jgi:hypothetical protein